MGTLEGKKKGGRVPDFAFELIQKVVTFFICADGMKSSRVPLKLDLIVKESFSGGIKCKKVCTAE